MNSFRFVAGLGETYLNQARSAIEQDLNGKAVDCVLEAIAVLAQYVNVCLFFCLFAFYMQRKIREVRRTSGPFDPRRESWVYPGFTSCPVLIHFLREILDCLKICWCHIKDEALILSVRLQVQLACGANFKKLQRESGKINFYLGGKINFVSILLISLWHTVRGFTKRCNEKKVGKTTPNPLEMNLTVV